MKLHDAIAQARYAKKLSLVDLEKLTGIANSILSNIETGKMVEPSFYKMVKIAAALGVDLDVFARTEMRPRVNQRQRRERAQRMRATWQDPDAVKAMNIGHRRAAKKLNKFLTHEVRLEQAERKRAAADGR